MFSPKRAHAKQPEFCPRWEVGAGSGLCHLEESAVTVLEFGAAKVPLLGRALPSLPSLQLSNRSCSRAGKWRPRGAGLGQQDVRTDLQSCIGDVKSLSHGRGVLCMDKPQGDPHTLPCPSVSQPLRDSPSQTGGQRPSCSPRYPTPPSLPQLQPERLVL